VTTRDPYTVILAARLGISEARARRAVAVFAEAAPLWKRWADAGEMALLLKWKGEAAPLGAAMVAARLVEPEGEGFVLAELDAPTIAAVLEDVAAEREAARERKEAERIRRDIAEKAVTLRDNAGNRVTSRYISPVSREFSESDGQSVTAGGVASPNTRAPGEGVRARGNLPPPTPSTPGTPATRIPAFPETQNPDPGDIPSLSRWLHAVLRRHGFTGPSKLDSSQQSELLDAIAAGLRPETLAELIEQAADNGARKMSWLRVGIAREMGDLAYRAAPCGEGDDESRAPPIPPAGRRGPSDPIPLEEARLIREHKADEPPGGMYEW